MNSTSSMILGVVACLVLTIVVYSLIQYFKKK